MPPPDLTPALESSPFLNQRWINIIGSDQSRFTFKSHKIKVGPQIQSFAHKEKETMILNSNWLQLSFLNSRQTSAFSLVGGKIRKSGSDGKESARNEIDLGSIPGLGRSPGEGNGNPLQYYCLENSVDRGAWAGYSPWGLESWTQLSD